MIEKIGAKNLKSSCRMMIEKVMIQLGVHFNRKGGGWGPREELAMLRMQEAKPKNQLGKHQDAKSQSQKAAKSQKAKPPKAKKPKSQKAKKPKSQKAKKPKSQKPKSQKATCRSGTGNAEDAKREEL